MTRTVKIGQAVIFIDEQRVEHDALVTMTWGKTEWDDEKPLVSDTSEKTNWPTCLNLVYVLNDEARSDQYGRQTRHVTSVVHESLQQSAGGYMWRHA